MSPSLAPMSAVRVGAEARTRIVGDETVGVGNGHGALRIDDCDFTAVDLLCGDKNAICQPGVLATCGVEFIEPCECGFALHFHIEPRNAPDEAVANGGDFGKRGKGLDVLHAQSVATLA